MPTSDKKPIKIVFPTGGIDLSRAFSMQKPGTTPVGVNVRGYDALTDRLRGGTRPGLSPFITLGGNPAQVNGFSRIQSLSCIVWVSDSAIGT